MGCSGVEDGTQGQMGSLLWITGSEGGASSEAGTPMRQGQSRPVTAVFPPGRQLVVAMGQSGRADAPWSSTGLCLKPSFWWKVSHPQPTHIGGLGSLVPVSMRL